MEITILKCDRCKKEVGRLIEFNFINRNVKEEKEDETHQHHLWGLLKKDNHPTVRGGLCLDCIQELSRWLGHPENQLTKC